MKKRVLAVLLSACMLAAAVPYPVLAASTEEIGTEAAAEEEPSSEEQVAEKEKDSKTDAEEQAKDAVVSDAGSGEEKENETTIESSEVEAEEDTKNLSRQAVVSANEKKYWIIFREYWRDSRIEKSTFYSPKGKDKLYIVWNQSLTINDTTDSSSISQYHLTEDKSWEYDREYDVLSSWGTEIIASNLDVRDADGNLIVSASDDRYPEGYNNFDYFLHDGEEGETAKATIMKYLGEGSNVVIPDQIGDYAIDGIGDGAFSQCTGVTSIALPEGVIAIGSSAFSGCSSLTSIYFSDNLTTVSDQAFYNCTSLKDVYYAGTEAEWKKISIGAGNTCLTNATIHYGSSNNELNFDTDVFKFNNYVHPDDKKAQKLWKLIKDHYKIMGKDSSYITGACYPHLTQEDFKDLFAYSPVDKKRLEEEVRYKHVGGHCFGMSTAVILNKIHATDSLANNYNIRDVSESSVCSKICLYHLKLHYSVWQERVDQFTNNQPTHIGENGKTIYDASAVLKDIENKVSVVKNGGIPVRISFSFWNWNTKKSTYEEAAHTIVGYGVDQINRTIENTTYTKRILVYDPNSPDMNEDTFIYYNDHGEWCIPYYDDCSSQNEAFFMEAANTLDEINCTGAISKTIHPLLSFSQDQSLSVKDGSTKKTVILNPSAGPSSEANSGWKSFADVTDSGDTAGNINYIVPSSADSYTLAPSSSEDDIEFSMLYGDKYISVSAESVEEVETTPDGDIKIVGNNGNYAVSVADNDKADDNYNIFTISGEGKGDLDFNLEKDGLQISGNTTATVVSEGNAEEKEQKIDNPVKEKIDSTTGTSTRKLFSDVTDPTNSYYDAIYWAASKGITTGYSDGTFGIGKNCSRGAFVTFLWRQQGSPEPTLTAEKSGLKDFGSIGKSYQKAVLWAVENGITTGYKDKTFRAGANVTRGAAVTFLYRAAGEPKVSITRNDVTLKDMVPAGSSYETGILWAVGNKITTGYKKDNTFRPANNCTRGATVTFLKRFDELR